MNEPKSLDKRSLLVQLESYTLILEVNSELFENYPHVREQITQRMERLGTYLNGLDVRERMEDQINSNHSVDQANRILEEIKVLLQQILDQASLPYDVSAELVENLRGAPLEADLDEFFDQRSS